MNFGSGSWTTTYHRWSKIKIFSIFRKKFSKVVSGVIWAPEHVLSTQKMIWSQFGAHFEKSNFSTFGRVLLRNDCKIGFSSILQGIWSERPILPFLGLWKTYIKIVNFLIFQHGGRSRSYLLPRSKNKCFWLFLTDYWPCQNRQNPLFTIFEKISSLYVL